MDREHVGTTRRLAARDLIMWAGAVGLCLGMGAPAWSQGTPAPTPATAGGTAPRTTGDARRDTLIRMMRPISVELKDQRLEDVMKFLHTVTGVDFDVMWADESNFNGLTKDKLITMNIKQVPALTALERILEKGVDDASGSGGNTWQMADSGEMQVGPKVRLNAFKRTEVYEIKDLVLELPNYTSAPQFDLNQALQSRRGGGGGQSPFRDQGNNQNTFQGRTLQERMAEVRRILSSIVEPEQWPDNGGDGIVIQEFQTSFIVSAPDYVHRAINGYSYWPSGATQVSSRGGRRYVSLNVDQSISKLGEIIGVPVAAVVGGQIIRSDGTRVPPP